MLCDEKLINSSISKTAALAGLVASARVSGHIVVYLPDGDRLRKHGFYIEPCSYREGLYNLPEIAKEFCEQLLLSHGEDLKEMTVSREDMGKHLSEDQITRLFSRANVDDESASELSMDKILEVGVNSTSLSSGCYGMVISALMNQTTKRVGYLFLLFVFQVYLITSFILRLNTIRLQ